MLAKPTSCEGCPLYEGQYGSKWGYVPQDGVGDNGVLIILEAAGEDEAACGRPVVGRAGQFMWQHLKPLGIDREGFRIHNVLSCRPPENKLLKMPYTDRAIACCAPNLDRTIADHVEHCRGVGKTPTIIALGKFSFKRLMGIESDHHPLLREDYFAYPHWLERYGCWLIAAPHPSHIMQGKNNLVPILQYVFERALEIANDGLQLISEQYTLDPTPEAFRDWVDGYFEALSAAPDTTYLSYDIETPYKSGKAEDEIAREDDDDYIILRCGYAYNRPDGSLVGCSAPWQPEYLAQHERLFSTSGAYGVNWNGCPTPDQKILTADLRWVEAGTLQVGDKLVGIDENQPEGQKLRKFKTSTVTFVGRGHAEVFEVVLSDGSAVKVTGEHPWLVPQRSRHTDCRSGSGWVKTTQLQSGDIVKKLFNVWEEDHSKEAGYLAGFFDGEGHLTYAGQSIAVGATQRIGNTLAYVLGLLNQKGFEQTNSTPSRDKDSDCCHLRITGGVAERARFLGSIRPRRLLDKFTPELMGSAWSPKLGTTKVMSVTSLGDQEFVKLSTSEHTYILEGFAAHNSGYDDVRIRQQVALNLVTLDAMLAWHVLNTSLPKGLGFVTPYYVKNTSMWKHLATPPKEWTVEQRMRQEAFYNAKDADMALRNWLCIKEDLKAHKLWDVFDRHVVQLNKVLAYMSGQGVLLDKVARQSAEDRLQGMLTEIYGRMQAAVPIEARALKVYKKEPKDVTGHVRTAGTRTTKQCPTCHQQDVTAAHFKSVGIKKLKGGTPENPCGGGKAEKVVIPADLWALPLDFKISKASLTKYQGIKKHKPVTDRKTKQVTFDVKAMKTLMNRYPEDQLYPIVLEYRKVLKLASTYVGVTQWKEVKVDGDYQLKPGERWADDPAALHQGGHPDFERWEGEDIVQPHTIDLEASEQGTEPSESAASS